MVGGGNANWGKFSGRLFLRRTKTLKNPAESFSCKSSAGGVYSIYLKLSTFKLQLSPRTSTACLAFLVEMQALAEDLMKRGSRQGKEIPPSWDAALLSTA
jgi:hypothetical protein